MNNSKEMLTIGCGIIGCANGYQYSSIGSDTYFNIANRYLDLISNIADALPDPDKRDLSPLFCLSQVEKEGHKILNLAEYHSIKQKGSNRSGTFLGSFIQLVDAQFDPINATALFDGLKKLCQYQYKHFVDHNENRYCVEISDKPFLIPELELKQLSSKLLSWNYPIPKQEREIYLFCQSPEQFELLLKLVIESGLLADFTRVYFSASVEITKSFQKSRIESLELNFNATEIWFRQYYNQKLYGASQYISELSKQIKDLRNNIQQEIERKSSVYVAQLEKANNELSNLVNRNKELSEFAEFGKSVNDLKEFTRAGHKLEEKFSSIESKLVNISALINHSVSNKSQQVAVTTPKPSTISTVLALFFGLLSILFLGFIIWSQFSEPSDKAIESSKKYQEMYMQKKNIEQELLQQRNQLNQNINQ